MIRTLRSTFCWTLLCGAAVCATACSSTSTSAARANSKANDNSYLFVQSCTTGTLVGNTLTLHNVGPTLYFTDRPARIEGHVRTTKLVENWDKGTDSFASNPPNAVLSVFGGSEVANATLILSNPRLVGSSLTYTVQQTEGGVPASFAEASLFIDNYRGFGMQGAYRPTEYHSGSHYHRVVYPQYDEGNGQNFIDLGQTGPQPPHLGF